MKTIMIATDFLGNSAQAAHYGYTLAQQLKADVVLCNAIALQTEAPQTGFVPWPAEQYDLMMDDSDKELENLKLELYKIKTPNTYIPHISYAAEIGSVTQVINDVAREYNADIIISGGHSASLVSELVTGNHNKWLIDAVLRPLIIVPAGFDATSIKRITIAADLKNLDQDTSSLLQVVALAKLLGAEIQLTYIDLHTHGGTRNQENFYQQLNELVQKSGYDKISVSVTRADNVEDGLDALCSKGQAQLLAMSHHPHGFWDSIVHGSHTKKMIKHITIPLMVIPAGR